MDTDAPLDADELMLMADRLEQLPGDAAEWVGRLFAECMRARMHEAELLSQIAPKGEQVGDQQLEAQLAQVALDAAEWLKTLWDVGYMGAGSFPSQPRSAFPLIELEDVLKSALFARIRQGKRPLPFPPPTRHGLPWHELYVCGDEVQSVEAEIVRDGQRSPVGAIIEGCANWQVIDEVEIDRNYVVQHRGKGPYFRLQFESGVVTLRREMPHWKRMIHIQERGGIRSFTLTWPQDGGHTQEVPLRATTWERAETEADYWIAHHHPEMYGQVSFVRVEVA